ncbi:MAG: glycosyltransferase family 2 protein [Chloroflexota bacterium]|nr:glycosyltransferase family 2 protein [Chloroflexota bacterium]
MTPDVCVLISTYNRQALLAQTLDSLASTRVAPGLSWEVIVVDNNCTDQTRNVIESRIGRFPAPLRRIFEGRPGKSHAINTGIRSSACAIFAFTDDDVLIPPDWLEVGVRPLLTRPEIAYTGGPVRPLWESPPPEWIHGNPGSLLGPISLVDYGPDEFIFEDRQRIPMGVNMAVRRALIDAVGGFHPNLGRSGSSLLGQEQAEFFFRTRAAGARGLYVPRMELRHHVPASRMTRSYYWRWWYWKGIARGRMQDLHPVSELGLDLRRVPHVARVPRFLWGAAVRHAALWAAAAWRGDVIRRAEQETSIAYFAGYLKGRWSAAHRRGLEPTPTYGGPTGAGT